MPLLFEIKAHVEAEDSDLEVFIWGVDAISAYLNSDLMKLGISFVLVSLAV